MPLRSWWCYCCNLCVLIMLNMRLDSECKCDDETFEFDSSGNKALMLNEVSPAGILLSGSALTHA